MVPKTVWAQSLLIYKELMLLHVGDLSDPMKFDIEQRADIIFNDLPGMHFSTIVIPQYLEIEIGWGDPGKIMRIAHK